MTDAGDSGSPEPVLRRRTAPRPVAPEEELDEATAISTRRAEPVGDETVISPRRGEPVDNATRRSARRSRPVDAEPVDDGRIDDDTRLSTRQEWPVDDATALSVRRGGAGGVSTVGPRRSPAPEPDGITQSAPTSPAEPEIVEDTILRPLRPAEPSSGAAEPAGPAFEAPQSRTAYVPTADDLAERREPRAPEVAVVSRAQTPSPKSLDRGEGGGSASGPQHARRLRPGIRLLILASAAVVVAVLAAVGLTLLLI